jgi:hypothetical protein
VIFHSYVSLPEGIKWKCSKVKHGKIHDRCTAKCSPKLRNPNRFHTAPAETQTWLPKMLKEPTNTRGMDSTPSLRLWQQPIRWNS